MNTGHSSFILELLNTARWIKFIGNRNVDSLCDAEAYIEKIMNNPAAQYWVVQLKDYHTCAGVITFIQRDYLDNPDIGFAFLPQYSGNGYAYEAASAVIKHYQNKTPQSVLAITLPANTSSIKLLEKLGLTWQRELVVEEELLYVYELSKVVSSK